MSVPRTLRKAVRRGAPHIQSQIGASGGGSSLRSLMVLFLSMMLVSALGIGIAPGNLPVDSLPVIGFLAAVLGLVVTSVAPVVGSVLFGSQGAYRVPRGSRRDGFYPSDFHDVNEPFWSRLKSASAKMAPLRQSPVALAAGPERSGRRTS